MPSSSGDGPAAESRHRWDAAQLSSITGSRRPGRARRRLRLSGLGQEALEPPLVLGQLVGAEPRGEAAAPLEHKPPSAIGLWVDAKTLGAKRTICNMQDGRARVASPAGRRPLLSTGAAARLAACHEATIRRAVRSGDLPAVRLGQRGNLRIAADELERWLRPALTEESP